MHKLSLRTAILFITLTLSGLASAQEETPDIMARDGAPVFNRLDGFLGEDAPDATAFLPPPPALDSVEGLAEMQIYHDTRKLSGTARWDMAAADAEGGNEHMWEAFSCALGAEIDNDSVPETTSLISRAMSDIGAMVGEQKNFYDKPRPFTLAEGETCVPAENLAANGSYPSGHSTVGWTWALLLSELVPERTGEIIGRGRAFAESRIICGVHYPSDVVAGQTMVTTLIMAMQSEMEFIEALAAAKTELGKVMTGAPVPDDSRCNAEAVMVQQRPW